MWQVIQQELRKNTAMDEGRLAGAAAAEALGHLAPEMAVERKKEINERLLSLRQGPFGERRMSAKERVLERGLANNGKEIRSDR